jgi:radical SAM superfamily enzyme YgiQ (UPF0313 family)
MRILLIKPPASVSFNAVTPPLGMMYLSSFLKQHGYKEVKIVHMDVEQMQVEDIKKTISEYEPDVVGLSAIISEAKNIYKIASFSKKTQPDALIVAGGAYPTCYAEDCLACPDIDMVVKGEGEEPFLEIIRNYEKGSQFGNIKGICFKKDGKVTYNEQRPFIQDIDRLPFPDWDGIKISAYDNFYPQSPFLYKRRYMAIFTSRGCPYQCIFCHNVLGKVFRAHSVSRVLEEMNILYNRYNISHIDIQDDIFNWDKQRAANIMEQIIESKMDLKIYFSNGIRGDLLDKETIDLFAQAGVVYLGIGIEAGTVRMQKKLKKYVDLGKIKTTVKYLRKKRIFSNAFFILGFPGEKLSDILRTIIFACSSGFHTASFFVLHLYKGTEIESKGTGKLAIDEKNISTSYAFLDRFVNYSDLPKPLLILIRRLANIAFYANPLRIYWIIRDLPNFKAIKILIAKFLVRTVI